MEDQLALAELLHQRVLLLDEDELAFVDDADAVRHLFRFFDVVRREDDRDAILAKGLHRLPHLAPELDVDTRRGLVEEEDRGSCESAFAMSTRRFIPPESVMILLSRLSTATDRGGPFSTCLSFFRLAEQTAAEGHRRPNGLEHVGRQLLR